MKVAMIHYDLPPEGKGGVCHVVHRLSNALVEQGVGVTVFTTSHKSQDANYDVITIKLGLPRNLPMLAQLFFALELGRQDYSGFDVIHAHGDSQFIFNKKPVVRTFHGSAFDEALHARNPLRFIDQMFLRYPLELLSGLMAKVNVGVSKNTKSRFPFIKEVVYQGVDREYFRPAEKSSVPSILFVAGRLKGRKRGDLLMSIFQEKILKEVPQAELWIACSDKISGENIRSYSDLDILSLAGLYQKAWVFCLPSTYEAFGIPYIEAMACGAAVVASPNEGAIEIIGNNEYGIISEDSKIAEDIITLLKDGGKRKFFEKKGLERSEGFSMEKMVEKYLSCYNKAMGKYK